MSDFFQKFNKPAATSFLALLLLASVVTAGSLTPPGAPSSTMNTLAEIYDTIAGAFDSTGVVADQNGSLLEHLKYIEDNMGSLGVGSDSLDFDEFVDAMTLDADTSIASGGFGLSILGNLEIDGTASISDTVLASESWLFGYGSVPSVNLRLGALTNVPTIPLYEVITFDNTSASNSLEFHSNRWATDVRFARDGSTGDRLAARLLHYADCCGVATSTFDLYNSSTVSNLVRVRLNAQGDSFFTGGKVGIGTTSPISQLHVPGSVPTGTAGSLTLNHTSAFSTYVQGRYAYIGSIGGGLQIVDISDPTAPASRSQLSISGIRAVNVQGHYLYTAQGFGDNRLGIYDVSNIMAPVLVGFIANADQRYVVVEGRYAYTLDTAGALHVYDVANPAAPTQAGVVTTGIAAGNTGMYVNGKYVYTNDASSGRLRIFNVANPAAPYQVSSTLITGTGAGLYVQGRYAYVTAESASALRIFDISNPSTPTLVGSVTTGAGPEHIFVQGRYAYVANYTAATLQFFDVSNPAAPVSVGSAPTSAGVYSLYVQGRYAYVTNFAAPARLETFDLGGSYIQQFETGGMETGTLMTRNNAHIGNDMDIRGGLIVARGANITGPFSVTSSVSGYTAFTVNPDGSASVSGTLETGGLVINGHLLPGANDTYDLGSSTRRWRDLYLASGSLHIGASGNEAVIDYQLTSNSLAFKPDGTNTRMVIQDGGNVGIGTSTPGYKLEIGTPGDLNLASSGAAFRISGNKLLHNKGTENIFVGVRAGNANTTGIDNTAVGFEALQFNTSGQHNTAIGYFALNANTTAAGNIAVGFRAMAANTTGASNTAVGRSALSSNTTGTENTATGWLALAFNSTGSQNTAHGNNALQSTTTGTHNTANGHFALFDNTTGGSNTANGSSAMLLNSTGTQNAATGRDALRGNITGNNNTAMGAQALRSGSNYSDTVGLGFMAGYYASASNNVFLGSNADIMGVGEKAGTITNAISIGSSAKVAASRQLVVGADNGINYLTEGYFGSGVSVSTPFGFRINATGGKGIDTAGANLTLAGGISTGTGTGGSLIFQTSPAGGAGVTANALVTRMTIDSTGNVFMTGLSAANANDEFVCRDPVTGEITFGATCTASSLRFKKNVEDLNHGLDWVSQLRPVTFDWKHNGAPSLGFIAEEVNEVTPLLALYQDGEVYSVNYQIMTAVLAKAIQELDGKIEDLATEGPVTFDEANLFDHFITYLRDAVLSVKGLIAETLEVREGITTYDKETGEPYCMVVSDGEVVARPGKCGAHVSTPTPSPTPSESDENGSSDEPFDQPSPTTTPETTPEPPPSPASSAEASDGQGATEGAALPEPTEELEPEAVEEPSDAPESPSEPEIEP